MRYFFLAIFMISTLSACVPPRRFQIEARPHDGSIFAGKATVYFFRNESYGMVVAPLGVEIDGQSQGSVRRLTYLRFAVEPGNHKLRTAWPPMLTGLYDFEISTEFKEDKTYYFVFETSWVLGAPKTVFTSTIKEIDPSQAAELMRTYTPREPSVKQAVTIGANPSDALAPGHRG